MIWLIVLYVLPTIINLSSLAEDSNLLTMEKFIGSFILCFIPGFNLIYLIIRIYRNDD